MRTGLFQRSSENRGQTSGGGVRDVRSDGSGGGSFKREKKRATVAGRLMQALGNLCDQTHVCANASEEEPGGRSQLQKQKGSWLRKRWIHPPEGRSLGRHGPLAL